MLRESSSSLLFLRIFGVSALLSAGVCGVACDGTDNSTRGDPKALFSMAEIEDFEEVVACRHSHEHDLRHIRVVADPVAADIYRRCVLDGSMDQCTETAFPEGSLFVKFEHDLDCDDGPLESFTATLRLSDGEHPEGHDWRWQRLTPKLEVVADGAPRVCLNCHEDHCRAPFGMELRCLPD